jgi:hypothetical protein
VSLTVEVRRTGELAAEDRARLCALFESVFHKPCPEDLFLRKYAAAWRGYSYHALARSEGVVVGSYSAVPFRYSFFGQEVLFATGVDLMVESPIRGNVLTPRSLSNALYSSLAADGIAFVFGCAREEMLLFHQRLGGWRTIGPMPYYVAPIRGPRLPGAAALLRVLVRAANLPAAVPPIREPEIYKVNDRAFRDYRYGILPTEYRTIAAAGGQGIYTRRLYYEIPGIPRGIRVSLLLDVSPFRADVFDEIVRAIRRQEPQIDYLAYQGWLPFRPKSMWRVPQFLERPHWYACGRILRPDVVDERIFEIHNWNINLSNGDLV